MTQPARVLVVEDDADALNWMMTLLSDWGYVVDGAMEGASALRLIENNCPAVVISDLVMPGMDGMELLKEIRNTRKDCSIFFILATGHACVPSAVSAIVEGADEVLVKPIDPDELHYKLHEHAFYGANDRVPSRVEAS